MYLRFKQYFIKAGWHLAQRLRGLGISANQSSILALIIMIPLIWWLYVLHREIDSVRFLLVFGIIRWIKLTLNAVDGIIARQDQQHTRRWMILNISTDLIPDAGLLYILLDGLGASSIIMIWMTILRALYLAWEIIYILLYHRQNMFCGKVWRQILYGVCLTISIFWLELINIVIFYTCISVIHVAWFRIRPQHSQRH
jgi:phosphatidylglycerophosphate synthase